MYSVNIRNGITYANARKNDEERREFRTTVQVTKKEKEILKILASRQGLSVSDYIRKIALYDPYNEIFHKDIISEEF